MPTIRRLDQALAARGFGSRKEIHALVRAAQVQINCLPAHDAAQKIDLESDQVTVQNEAVNLQEYVYIMLHKPPGVVSAARDPQAPTVLDLLPANLYRRGLFPAGRLDKDTTGLLLITDDGALSHALLSPRRHVPKTYLAELERPVLPADIKAFAAGIHLPAAEGHPPEDCLPAELEILENSRARIVLHEGKYHQVKRMFAARGNRVLSLHREAMGTLRLDEALVLGACRELTGEEVEGLRRLKTQSL